MLKKYCKNLFALVLVFVMMSNTISYAATKEYVFFSEWQAKISQAVPYISPTFVPQTNSIWYHYEMISSEHYKSTYYVERYSNGRWIVEESETFNGLTSVSADMWVTPGATYRIRAVTNDPYKRTVHCEVTEIREVN